MDKIETTLEYSKEIKKGGSYEFIMEVSIPDVKILGVKELIITAEAFEIHKDKITPEKLYKKGFWTYFDYRIRWVHEENFFVNITKEIAL